MMDDMMDNVITMDVGCAYVHEQQHHQATILVVAGTDRAVGLIPSELRWDPSQHGGGQWILDHPDAGSHHGVAASYADAVQDAAQDALSMSAEAIREHDRQGDLQSLQTALRAHQSRGDRLAQQVWQMQHEAKAKAEVTAEALAAAVTTVPTRHLRPRSLGERVMEVRAVMGLTYTSIGADLGVSGRAVRTWCAGRCAPTGRRPALIEAWLARHDDDVEALMYEDDNLDFIDEA